MELAENPIKSKQKVKQKQMKKIIYFAVPALITVAIFSCSKESLKTQTVSQTQTQTTPVSTKGNGARLADVMSNVSDIDLFEGIFYLKGAVADQVPALANLKTQLNNGDLNFLTTRGDNVV